MLLTTAQYKLDKSSGRGYKTVGLNLSPDVEASTILGKKLPTMCAMAGACAAGCLVKTGMNVFPASARARASKTEQWLKDPKTFVWLVDKEIRKEEAKALKKGMKFAVRPNLLSDQRKLAVALAKLNPMVQFYDYTKLPMTLATMPTNYHLTYSVSERTTRGVLAAMLTRGINPAMVFDTKRGKPLPTHYTLLGKSMPVIDGDADDLRFLDPRGVIVGLRWKGSNARLVDALAGGFAFYANGHAGRLA